MLQRFLPSEFGHDVVRADPVEPGLRMYKEKREIRRLVEEYGIPYTYICCNSIASWPYYDNKHPAHALPPLEHFKIYGDGTVKGTSVCNFCFSGHRNGFSFLSWRGYSDLQLLFFRPAEWI
jgi:leucoanthocyanidin reductase